MILFLRFQKQPELQVVHTKLAVLHRQMRLLLLSTATKKIIIIFIIIYQQNQVLLLLTEMAICQSKNILSYRFVHYFSQQIEKNNRYFNGYAGKFKAYPD